MALGYSIAYVLLVVLAFLLLSYAAPKRYQVKVTRGLAAPPERVWVHVSEPGRFPQWFPGVLSCEHVDGPQRGVGQVRRVRFEHKGRRGEREEEATRWEESRLIELTHRWEKVGGKIVPWEKARSEFRLAATPLGTEVTGVLWFSGRHSLGRVLALLSIRKRHEKEFRAALLQLEQRLAEESASADAATAMPPRDAAAPTEATRP